MGRRFWLIVVVAVAPALLAGLALARIGDPPPAPATGRLPLVNGLRVIASTAGGSAVDSGSDHRQYRYIVLAGPVGEQRGALVASEVRYLEARAWMDEVSWIEVTDSSELGHARVAPPSARGANVMINAPGGRLYAALGAVLDQRDADQQTDGTPLFGNRAIRRALRSRVPVILVELADGKHGPL